LSLCYRQKDETECVNLWIRRNQTSKNIEDLISYDFHTPATEEVWEYLKSNFKVESSSRKVVDYNFITVQCAAGSLFLTDYAYDNFIPTDKFKEIIGMTDKKTFTKADLKDGMLVDTVRGRYLVLSGRLVNFSGWLCLSKYLDDLSVNSINREYDIQSVWELKDHTSLHDILSSSSYTPLWKRPPAKTQTKIELEKLQQQIAELQAQANKLQQTL